MLKQKPAVKPAPGAAKKPAIRTLPLLPLRDIVVFPGMVVPLLVGREKSIKAVDEASKGEKLIMLCAQKNAKEEDPAPGDVYETGTMSEVLQFLKLPDGSVRVLVEGKQRMQVVSYAEGKDFTSVKVKPAREIAASGAHAKALARTVISQFDEYVKLNPRVPPETITMVSSIENPGELADAVSAHLTIKLPDKQQIHAITDQLKRLTKVNEVLISESELLRMERKIMDTARKQIEESQKNYFLQEQLKAIEKELESKGKGRSEVNELKQKIKKSRMPEDAAKTAEREVEKFSRMMPLSPESTVTRNYVDWLVSLPWSVKTKDKLDIKHAEKVLEEDHYGLEKPKQRILEYLAVRKLSKKMKGPILCFVGPPGVGKTSLAKSIARALGRKFARVSLGGIRDEAEIRGHRRTYIGALPGRVIQSVRKAGTKNPVFLLDEIDKMAVDFHGDPSAALLEVLDPEQNHAFSDHYLEVDFDLSDVLFITTCNTRENIPPALDDRMEVIPLPGYTEHEKLNIARLFLIPKQLKANGLTGKNIRFSDNALQKITWNYTREAGVRNLEREIAKVCRKVAKNVVSGKKSSPELITAANLKRYLGPEEFLDTRKAEQDEVGVATGLAWTETGGDVITVEVTALEGKGNLTLTGKLGDIMQESAHAAVSYVRSRARKLGISPDFYRKYDIHIHVPEGAVPKDGPSAGITMAAALASSLSKVPIRKDVAMTGEITLRGRVLQVGGLKSKLLAAHRAKIGSVIVPKENEKEMVEIPKNIKKEVDIKFAENMDEVLKFVLVEKKSGKRRKK